MSYYRTGTNGKCGVYLITNTVNGKRYVGASVNVGQRVCQHFSSAMKKYKDINDFYNDIYKFGRKAFTVELLEECTPDCKLEREVYWYEKLHPEYNLTRPTDQPFLDPAVREKSLKNSLSEKALDRKRVAHRTDEYRLKMKELKSETMTSCIATSDDGIERRFDSLCDAARWVNEVRKTDSKICSVVSHIKYAIHNDVARYGHKWKVVMPNEDYS